MTLNVTWREIFVPLTAVFIALCGTASGEISPLPTPERSVSPHETPPLVTRGEDVLLQFESMLESEAKAHREYLEKTLETLKWAVGIFGVLAVAAFTWLNYKSGKDIRAQVNARFRTSIDALVDKRVEELDTLVKSNRERIEANMTETNTLMGKTAEFAAAWTGAFTLLEQPSKEEKYELARRDAMRQLEGMRPNFSYFRHLGILLARLHVHFEDYEGAVLVLTDVIGEREKKHMPHDLDYGALLYSRACYKNRLAEKCASTDAAGAERLRIEAWKDLHLSIQSDPENLKEAAVDSDLATLWNDSNRKRDSLKAVRSGG